MLSYFRVYTCVCMCLSGPVITDRKYANGISYGTVAIETAQ